jgi:Domain of unknown function (DUF1707)
MAIRPGSPNVTGMTSGTQQPDVPANGPVRRDDGAPRLRASDAERAATVEVLRDAVARGLLDHDEGGARMAAAFAVRFRDELPPLTADLPAAPADAAPPAPGWRSVGSAALAQLRADVRATVAAGPRSRRFVLTVLLVLLVLGLLLALGGLAVHGLLDGGSDGGFGDGPWQNGPWPHRFRGPR